MAGIQDFWCFEDDFFGVGAVNASPAGNDIWDIADTSTTGTPTYAKLDGAATGVLQLAFDSEAEAQNVCLSFGDVLCMDIDLIQAMELRVQQAQATIDSATSMAFGLAGDRNDAIDSIAQNILFRLIGSNAVVVETDDGTTDNDDVATGQTLTNAWKTFKIDFSQGTSDVRFYMSDANGSLVRVAATTTFDMSGYTGSLQPYVQIQKTADANTDGLQIDYIKVWGKRR